MKNLLVISAIIIIIVLGILFLTSTENKETGTKAEKNNLNQSVDVSKKDQMDEKKYPNFPGVLPENERIGKKASFETSEGNFTVALFGDEAPKAVSSFIFLAKKGFFNGLTFHRIIPGFMIQGGDPLGTGTGGPGYKFEDEFDASLTFSKPGILAMANSGPGTNGSQFFITVAPTPHLNNKHTIFGEVVEGYSVVEKISTVQTNSNNKPLNPIVIKKIEIL